MKYLHTYHTLVRYNISILNFRNEVRRNLETHTTHAGAGLKQQNRLHGHHVKVFKQEGNLHSRTPPTHTWIRQRSQRMFVVDWDKANGYSLGCCFFVLSRLFGNGSAMHPVACDAGPIACIGPIPVLLCWSAAACCLGCVRMSCVVW